MFVRCDLSWWPVLVSASSPELARSTSFVLQCVENIGGYWVRHAVTSIKNDAPPACRRVQRHAHKTQQFLHVKTGLLRRGSRKEVSLSQGLCRPREEGPQASRCKSPAFGVLQLSHVVGEPHFELRSPRQHGQSMLLSATQSSLFFHPGVPGVAHDKTYCLINFCWQVSCQVLFNYFSLADLFCAVLKRSQSRNGQNSALCLTVQRP